MCHFKRLPCHMVDADRVTYVVEELGCPFKCDYSFRGGFRVLTRPDGAIFRRHSDTPEPQYPPHVVASSKPSAP